MLQFNDFILHYGYFAVYFFLALGIFGLPLPDELVVAFIGHLTSTGTLNFPIALIITILGVMSGTVFTYALGRNIGKPLLIRYGKWVSLSSNRLKRVDRWFEKYGPWAVTLGYFVPGMRHIICYLSGSAGMDMRRYLIFAAIGTGVSTVICLSIGYWIKFPF